MNRTVFRGLAVLALAVPLFALTLRAVARDDDDDDKEKLKMTAATGKDFREFVKKVSSMKGADLKKASEEFAKGHPMEFTMYQFKPRRLNGLGVGEPKDMIKPDAIELKLIAMADPKKKLTKAELAKQSAALVEMAERVAAIAEVTHFYVPKEKKPGKDPADWAKFTDAMVKSSKELADAAKAKDDTKVFAAASNLNASCNDCHAIFRAK
jgi:hypothetical protein